MNTENTIVVMIGLVALAMIVKSLIMICKDQYDKGYKQGQLDAAKEESKYVLVEFEDGTRKYMKEDDLEYDS